MHEWTDGNELMIHQILGDERQSIYRCARFGACRGVERAIVAVQGAMEFADLANLEQTGSLSRASRFFNVLRIDLWSLLASL